MPCGASCCWPTPAARTHATSRAPWSSSLTAHGLVVRMLEDEAKELDLPAGHGVELVTAEDAAPTECELAVVIGGDGTILRAAELTHGTLHPAARRQPRARRLPRGGRERGRREDDRADRRAEVLQRGAADPRRRRSTATRSSSRRTWALNEASVEKAARQRMLEVVVEVDGRPLSRFGCDGVVCATPTGSTAYNFSAGGPIVWPGVEALLMVPISAHALFARPMVVAPTSVLAVEVLAQTEGAGVLWCDGRRTVDLPPGARIEVRRGRSPVRLVRLHAGAVHRPAGGQVRPARRGLAWRGRATPAQRRPVTGAMIEEIRISSLGVIDESVLELGDRTDRDHRRDRCRQDHAGDRARAAAGRPGRHRSRAHRSPGRPGRGRGPRRCRGGGDRRRARRRGRGRPAAARPPGLRRGSLARRSWAAPRSRRRRCPASGRRWWPCTGSPTSTACSSRRRSATRWTPTPAPACTRCSAATAPRSPGCGPWSPSCARCSARRASEPARPTCCAWAWRRSRRSTPSPARRSRWPPRSRGSGSPTRCARPPRPRARRCPPSSDAPDALGAVAAARRALESVREHDPEVAALADRVAEVSYLLADVAADVASYSTGVETDPARLAAVSERRAALTALTRKYGETRRPRSSSGPASPPSGCSASTAPTSGSPSCAPSVRSCGARSPTTPPSSPGCARRRVSGCPRR